jgi:hypothetical protein
MPGPTNAASPDPTMLLATAQGSTVPLLGELTALRLVVDTDPMPPAETKSASSGETRM